MAHNLSGYDGYFILQGLVKEGICPKIIPRGGKVLLLSIPGKKIKFIDSLLFVPIALRKLPGCFGMSKELLRKGDFPHRMNCEQYMNYEGSMPPKELWWCPDSYTDEQRVDFEDWYAGKVESGYVFNFKNEIVDYCINDVKVLRICMNSFQDEFQETRVVDPFHKCITLPSACMRVFHTHFLTENTIGLINNTTTTHGNQAIYWLLHKEETEGITIRHARNG